MSIRASCTGKNCLMLAGVSIGLDTKGARAMQRMLNSALRKSIGRKADRVLLLPVLDELTRIGRDYPCNTLAQAKKLADLRDSFNKDILKGLK